MGSLVTPKILVNPDREGGIGKKPKVDQIPFYMRVTQKQKKKVPGDSPRP